MQILGLMLPRCLLSCWRYWFCSHFLALETPHVQACVGLTLSPTRGCLQLAQEVGVGGEGGGWGTWTQDFGGLFLQVGTWGQPGLWV